MKTFIVACLLFVYCCSTTFARVRDIPPDEVRVSIVELLANPKEFHEKKVRVVGCYWIEEGGGEERLFLSKDTLRIWDAPSSVVLSKKGRLASIKPSASGLFMEVVGIFIYDEKLRDRFITSISNAAPMESSVK